MDSFIPYGRQDISQDDIDAVVEVLRSEWLTQGPAIERFEQSVADYCGVKYAVAVSSATAGLHIACLAAGLGKDDVLWTSPNTFVASANCGLYCAANVDFVDIDPKTYNLSVENLKIQLGQAEQQHRLPKILIPVHFAGQSCEMEPMADLAQRYGFRIIEDAAHGIGGFYKERPIGSCTFSDMTVLSFHPVKIITTGEGGMVLTNHQDLYEKLIRLRSHGITRNPDLMQEASHGSWYYQQLELGFHYRITDIQAALGASQMHRLEQFVKRRHYLAKRYDQWLKELPLTLPWQHPDTSSSRHLYVIRLELNQIKKTQRQVFEALRKAGIGVNIHYIPVHLQPHYQKIGFKKGAFPESERYYAEAISLPIYYGLSEEDQDRVIATLHQVIS
jgi:UDP-4-amino-4,6-dideoxy-N-acetyl-beta-L-altrosamine transaminase